MHEQGFYCIYIYIVCKLIQPILHSINCFLLSWHWAESVAHYLIITFFPSFFLGFPNLIQCLDFSVYWDFKIISAHASDIYNEDADGQISKTTHLAASSVLDLGKRRETLCLTGVCAKFQARNCELVVAERAMELKVLINAVQTRVSSFQ